MPAALASDVLYRYSWFDYEIETLLIFVLLLVGVGAVVLIFSGVIPTKHLYELLSIKRPRTTRLWVAVLGGLLLVGSLVPMGWGVVIGHVYAVTFEEPDLLVRHRHGLYRPTTRFQLSEFSEARFVKAYTGGRPWTLSLQTQDGVEHHLLTLYQHRRHKADPLIERIRWFMPVTVIEPHRRSQAQTFPVEQRP
ncbi:MAG: hypothetical protein EA397_00735 [Deltaproteobacteria bacterium]|nr:MAG: hypothetical protein EA397_00735 [Deltaproteobacteria bacterium]